mgnify:FL=1|tara:strand:+ start:355 stop:567 length:213 start_codon:yes stop_codon:yes gene_type:complete
MTRPYLGPDTTYSQQRKDRMQDAIDDYLCDDEVTAHDAYNEMLECVKNMSDYHLREYLKAQELYDLMSGK